MHYKITKRLTRDGFRIAESYRPYLSDMGVDCYIGADTVIEHPELVEIGSNVRLAGCTLLPYEGSAVMLSKAYGVPISSMKVRDRITIGSDVFVGLRTIVLRGVTIGSRVVIGAGAIITRDVPDDVIVVGTNRIVGKTKELVARLAATSRSRNLRAI